MQICDGRLTEVWMENGLAAGRIACPVQPGPGQYVLAQSLERDQEALPAALFAGGEDAGGFIAAPALPAAWRPGEELRLRGPAGKGFWLPDGTHRVCLLALDVTPSRLLPLAAQAFKAQAEAALVCDPRRLDLAPQRLPTWLEVEALEALRSVLAWADFLAIDLPATRLPLLRQTLGVRAGEQLSCAAQALVLSSMPCGGAAECGACAVKGKRGWKLTCKEGPVFDLNELEW